MRRLASAALLLAVATALRVHQPDSEDAAAAAELSAVQGGQSGHRSECLEGFENLCDPTSGSGVLITGSGGAGTHSISAMFKMNGLDLAHERVGRNGSVSWPYFVDVTHTGFSGDSCVRNSYLSPPKTHYRRVYHVVRCPIDAISVMVTHSWCSMRFIDSTLKLGMDGANQDDPRFWAKAWLEMNKFIENYAQQTFTLDNYTGLFQQVCRDSGLPDDKCLEASMPSRHHRNHETFSWEKLNAMVGTELTEAIRSAAVRYGFGEDCVDDQIRALKRKQELSGQQVVTHGIPGAECSEEAGQDCTDGLDWVWEASVAERMRRGGEASFREAWAGL